jgi:hypothetical protein
MLTKMVKDAWWKGQVMSTLFLDVKGAFPSIDIKQLFHNMQRWGIPKEYIEWMKWWLGGRHTTISFDDFQTEIFIVLNGLDQGDPFLGICYLFYNADLLKIPDTKNSEHMLLYVNDAAIIVTGADFKEIHEKLWNIMNQTNSVFD